MMRPPFSLPGFGGRKKPAESEVTTAEPVLQHGLGGKEKVRATDNEIVEIKRGVSPSTSSSRPRIPPSKISAAVSAKMKGIKQDMTEEEAAVYMQRCYAGMRVRKKELNLALELNFAYETEIMELREHRRGLVFGLVYHVIYMILLFGAFTLQHGSSVGDRFALVQSIKGEISSIATADGTTFKSMSNLDPQLWDWSDTLVSTLGGQDRVYMRTYNQVVGSMRMESMRVSSESCAYKSLDWTEFIFGRLRSKLWESEARHPECYGSREAGLESAPFGPNHDPTKWLSEDRGQGSSYKVDLGKDPRFAGYKLQEMRRDGFVSKSTRQVTISMAVYNNALPMLCEVKLVFEMSRTGELDTFFTIEAMNPMPYANEYFWLQATLELLVLLCAISHAIIELLEMRGAVRKLGFSEGLHSYCTDFWNVMDWAGVVLVALFYVYWLRLLFDTSRDVDLDTTEYVDLQAVALDYVTYNLLFNMILLLSLFSLLRYTELDHRMALLTRSISESLGDLLPFGVLFCLFLFIFAAIGYLLYGPLLYEWSTLPRSIVTAIDIMIGNYQYIALEVGIPKDSLLKNIVGVIFFYVYFFLMMLITLNIVIAILMDGYASVKERTGSDVEERLSHNVGTLGSIVFGRTKNKKVKSPLGHKPWTDARWTELLHAVMRHRESLGGIVTFGRVGAFMANLRALTGLVYLSPEELKDMAWQIKHCFQQREFMSPPDITQPYDEPKLEDKVHELGKDLKFLLAPMEARLRDLHRALITSEAVAANIGKPPTTPSAAPASSAAARASSSDVLGNLVDSARADAGSSDTLGSANLDAQQLWELVLSQQQMIAEQQKTIARHQAVMHQAHQGVAALMEAPESEKAKSPSTPKATSEEQVGLMSRVGKFVRGDDQRTVSL